ncbi:Acetyl-coenzyme A synthetase [Baekduia alba]|uniref:AMP-binding protein n=1 Tax=Baekduia alba TaxID=2997333 RepID=UPI0023421143|nr:AMP-binding protein [Baekduia alba]WCB94951.1 Acetyl-coenzyme A synthetase [Baekduia alba]
MSALATSAAASAGYAYVPTREQVEVARVTGLMARTGAGSLAELRVRSAAEPAWFWPHVIDDLGLPFAVPPTTVLDASAGPEWTRWFIGGQINVAAACVDRWAADPRTAGAPALIGESEDGSERRLTFAELAEEVDRAAAGLRALGVRPGDAVAVFMPMIVEAAIAAYAIAKVGALWVPVFSGYAAGAVASRLQDAGCRVVVCADGTRRKGRAQRLKPVLDEALAGCPEVTTAIVVEHLGEDVPMRDGRDITWAAFVRGADARRGRDPEPTSSEHPFLLAYTSGTTGRPKGAVHVHGGFLVKVASEAAYSMDIGRGDRLLWVTDMGWIMGPWCLIGAHAQGAAVVLLDAAPDHPAPSRLWDVAARHGVTHLGVSPTLVRALQAAGDEHAGGHDLDALRILGSTGEPWNAEPYDWLMRMTDRSRPIINISGGTEVGACLLAPCPIEPLKACSLGGPSLGVALDVFDDDARPVRGAVGELVCTRPWPGMTRGIWGDAERYLATYWSRFPGVWHHGDWARVDEDGQWFLLGRSDETINIAGQRLGPAEVESALVADPTVAEAAAVGVPDALKGEALWCFWAPVDPAGADASARLAGVVAAQLGRPFTPARVIRVAAIPKTRSGKVLRRALRAAALGEDAGDLSAAEDPAAIARIRDELRRAGDHGPGG